MKPTSYFIIGIICLLFWGCPSQEEPQTQPALLPKNKIQYHLIAAGEFDGQVRVRGFKNSTPSQTSIEINYNDKSYDIQSDETGQFDFIIDSPFIPNNDIVLSFELDDRSWDQTYQIRAEQEHQEQVTKQTTVTGQIPNDLFVASNKIWVLSSADSLLQEFTTDSTTEEITSERNVYFPIDDQNRGGNPYQFAIHSNQNIAAVSLFTQHTIAIVDLERMTLIDRISLAELPLIELDEPLFLSAPQDANNDGTTETEVSTIYPHHPQALIWQEDTLWVGATNFLEFSSNGLPPTVAPGTLLQFSWLNDKLTYQEQWQLKGKNPQDLLLTDTGLVILTTGTALLKEDGSWQQLSPAALWELPHENTSVLNSLFEFNSFTPAHMNLVENNYVFGNTQKAQLGILNTQNERLELETLTLDENEQTDSIFSTLSLGGGLLAIAQYNKDQIWFYDMQAKEMNPWPFRNPLTISAQLSDSIFKGLLKLAKPPGQPLVEHHGFIMYALTGLSSELIPIDLGEILGP